VRVLYLLTDGFGRLGGIAQFNRDLLKAICSHPGVSEVVAFPRYAGKQIGQTPPKLTYDLSCARGKLHYALGVIVWLLRRNPVNLIVCTHLNLQPLAAVARRITGAPSVLVLHGVEGWTPPRAAIRRAAVRDADWVVAVSRYTLTRFGEWASLPEGRSAVLPCCVDLERFTPGPPSGAVVAKYGLANAAIILTLGRLAGSERYKGFDELLEVLGELRGLEPNLFLVIAGSGDDRARLEAKARTHGVHQFVRFTGYVPDEELIDLYRASRVFVLAGRGEGFGIVLLEAMACGIPVVASTLDGSFEAVREGKLGFVVDPGDRNALIAVIRDALHRPNGIRPAGLEDLSYQAFEKRAHDLLQDAAGTAIMREGMGIGAAPTTATMK
jgi:glycosyltransferase involved in cell wall biosynthesis